jgi:anti-anti-sigma factor
VPADFRDRVERRGEKVMSEFHKPAKWGYRVAHDPDGVTRIALAGELDVAVASDFRARLIQVLAESASVILDLRELEFMDSSGIHALEAADARARALSKRLVIAHPTPAVLRVLELTEMNEILEIVDASGAVTALIAEELDSSRGSA